MVRYRSNEFQPSIYFNYTDSHQEYFIPFQNDKVLFEISPKSNQINLIINDKKNLNNIQNFLDSSTNNEYYTIENREIEVTEKLGNSFELRLKINDTRPYQKILSDIISKVSKSKTKLSNEQVEILHDIANESLELMGFSNTKKQKSIREGKHTYLLLVAVDSSNGPNDESYKTFPCLITIDENGIKLEYFICKDCKPLQFIQENREILEKYLENINNQLAFQTYELKLDKKSTVLSYTLYPFSFVKEFLMVEFLKKFSISLTLFLETAGNIFKILTSQPIPKTQYKLTMKKFERFYLNCKESPKLRLYPELFKQVRYCPEEFLREKEMIDLLKTHFEEFRWCCLDEETFTVSYPYYEGAKYEEYSVVLRYLSLVFKFYDKLGGVGLRIRDIKERSFIATEQSLNLIFFSEPYYETFVINDKEGDKEINELGMQEFLNTLFRKIAVNEIKDEWDELDIENREGVIIGDNVKLVKIGSEKESQEEKIIYGYFRQDSQFFLVYKNI